MIVINRINIKSKTNNPAEIKSMAILSQQENEYWEKG
jgi:hypothetical protein